MSYTIDIIDTLDNSHFTVLESAAQSSVVLSWAGSDNKDELKIVGSKLDFTLFDKTNEDGRFSDLFTNKETRFRVWVYHTLTGVTIWNGFLLPDQYGEPYTSGNTFVDLTATDGLGRLRGKYLTDDFYGDEKSIIQLISKCLELTGLQLDLFFSPAIENSVQKDWNEIFISTKSFIKDGKKKTAFQILDILMNDLLCCVYQSNDRWNVEGLNKRHFREITYQRYLYTGEYVSPVEVIKTQKTAVAMPVPFISMVPAYGEILVLHERAGISLPDEIIQSKNKGWAITTGVVGSVYPKHWFSNGGFNPVNIQPDYYLNLPVLGGSFDAEKYIGLSDKIYLRPGDKLKFSGKFRLKIIDSYTLAEANAVKGNADWSEILRIDILIAGDVYSQNLVSFEDSGNGELDFDIISELSGLMDVRIYQPAIPGNFIVEFVEITEFEISEIGFVELEQFNNTINDDFTNTKEHELDFTDGITGIDNSFRLQRLELKTQDFQSINVPILYGFTQNGNNYSVVQLDGANLIENNIDRVKFSGSLIEILGVVYNYATGEQMVVLTPTLISAGEFVVDVYKNNDVVENRSYWLEWSDSVYKIEKQRYAQAIGSIFRRMFAITHHKIEMDLKQSIKFNDFVTFPYLGGSNYPVLNCSWDISRNKSAVIVARPFYQDGTGPGVDPSDNIAPIVNAGEDFSIGSSISSTTITSTAFDPDGFIVSYLWEIVSGVGVIVNPNQANTAVKIALNSDAVFRITVTDNDGATAFDEIAVSRSANYSVTIPVINQNLQPYSSEMLFQLVVQPVLNQSIIIKFSGFYSIAAYKESDANSASANFYIEKNGVKIINKYVEDAKSDNGTVEFNFISTDNVKIYISSDARVDDPAFSSGTPTARAQFDISNFEFIAGNGAVVGLPIGASITSAD
tara:strand:- start:2801 stop:5524 length:2724 start_codon:yes stop_codon:yes gene_type:complete